jgi:hypothetical protein
MFIARRTKTPPAAFGGAELYSRAEALVAFRSSERRWFFHFNSGYKHLTHARVESVNAFFHSFYRVVVLDLVGPMLV